MTVYALGVVTAATIEQLDHRDVNSNTGILSLVVVVAMLLVDMALCWLVDHRPRGGAAGPRTIHASYVPVLRQAVHITVTVGGLYLIAGLWGIDLFALTARRTGERLAGDLIDIAVTLLLAYLAWHFVKTEIDRRLAPEVGPGTVSAAGEPGGTGPSRLHTLLPLLRGCLLATICAMAALIVLAEFGVQIAPLMAGAGVVGIAVGFGAQTLVRDVISGAFYLMDDAFRLGEYIDVGDAKGTVERIGIRSMQLRHQRGAFNIVPYGTIRRLNNQSRDWVIEQLEFRVTYDTDITKVKKIIKRIGEELMADPELGSQMLQPLKSQGVMAMEDNALLVKAKFMAKPGEQSAIRREAYQRIKQAFDENRIKFAYRQVTVHVPPGGGGPQASEVATAAAAADEE
jgi:small-conductance mechanosensitive channel